jgi:phosphopantetheinyl transferase (holo-ACP synthase)
MSDSNASGFLSRLLGRPVTVDDEILLSSAQRVRFHAWLSSNGFSFDEGALARRFCLRELLGELHREIEPRAVSEVSARLESTGAEGGYIGVDMQKVAEMFPEELPQDLKSSGELKKIFTLKELSYAATRPAPAATLAGIFAAKEAVLKCMDGELPGLTHLEILPDSRGRPSSPGFRISISHSGEYAVAVAQQLQVANQQVAARHEPPPVRAHVTEAPSPRKWRFWKK